MSRGFVDLKVFLEDLEGVVYGKRFSIFVYKRYCKAIKG